MDTRSLFHSLKKNSCWMRKKNDHSLCMNVLLPLLTTIHFACFVDEVILWHITKLLTKSALNKRPQTHAMTILCLTVIYQSFLSYSGIISFHCKIKHLHCIYHTELKWFQILYKTVFKLFNFTPCEFPNSKITFRPTLL